MSNNHLVPLVASEGYCCLYGYLKLCRERGEKPKDMAKNMGVAHSTIVYNYGKIADGRKSHTCRKLPECLMPTILEIRATATPPSPSASPSEVPAPESVAPTDSSTSAENTRNTPPAPQDGESG